MLCFCKKKKVKPGIQLPSWCVKDINITNKDIQLIYDSWQGVICNITKFCINGKKLSNGDIITIRHNKKLNKSVTHSELFDNNSLNVTPIMVNNQKINNRNNSITIQYDNEGKPSKFTPSSNIIANKRSLSLNIDTLNKRLSLNIDTLNKNRKLSLNSTHQTKNSLINVSPQIDLNIKNINTILNSPKPEEIINEQNINKLNKQIHLPLLDGKYRRIKCALSEVELAKDINNKKNDNDMLVDYIRQCHKQSDKFESCNANYDMENLPNKKNRSKKEIKTKSYVFIEESTSETHEENLNLMMLGSTGIFVDNKSKKHGAQIFFDKYFEIVDVLQPSVAKIYDNIGDKHYLMSTMISFLIRNAHQLDKKKKLIKQITILHNKYNINFKLYDITARALILTIKHFKKTTFTSDMILAWKKLFTKYFTLIIPHINTF
jgi:hemoglobin-like flavoprotein